MVLSGESDDIAELSVECVVVWLDPEGSCTEIERCTTSSGKRGSVALVRCSGNRYPVSRPPLQLSPATHVPQSHTLNSLASQLSASWSSV